MLRMRRRNLGRMTCFALVAMSIVGFAVASAAPASASTVGSAIVNVARGQAGYKASPYGTNCNKFSAYWGSGANDCGNGNRPPIAHL